MKVLGVVIAESVLVNIKVHFLGSCLLDCEYSTIVAIIGKSKLSLDVLQRQNVGGVSFIKPYLTISLYIGFTGSLNGSVIPSYCHGLICCPDFCDKHLVTEEVNSVFII